MDDKRLTELAAQAAGIEVTWYASGTEEVLGLGKFYRRECDRSFPWSPLDNDGDAFRLAVKLKLHIEWDGCEVQVFEENYDSGNPICAGEVWHDGQDQYAATRRAITSAAAAIAEQQHQGGV